MTPQPSTIFSQKKTKILSQLSVPDTEYADASPKGSVDAGIRDLIDEINALDGVVTTSSCAGRVSVYLEGVKTKNKKEEEVGLVDERSTAASSAVGGKGGGEWLFVSHDPLPVTVTAVGDGEVGGGVRSWGGLFGLEQDGERSAEVAGVAMRGVADRDASARLIHFKFEPMILHVLTASHELAQLIVQAGMEAGFRETGAVSLLAKHQSSEEAATPMVAVRSMGLSFESLIGAETADGRRCSIVSPEYLDLLVQISHERFAENQKRISRFREALKAAFAQPGEKKKSTPEGWEDSEARRERKRQEGLKRRNELKLKVQESSSQSKPGHESSDLDLILQVPDVL